MQNDKSNGCYFCNAKKTSMEHLPPKCFFPKGKRNNLITVPSCDEHNSSKSMNDEYIKTLFANASEKIENDSSLISLLESSHRAMFERKSRFRHAILNQAKICIEPSGKEVVYAKVCIKRIHEFFNCLSRGLFFHQHKKRFEGKTKIHIHFLEKDTDQNILNLFNQPDISGDNRDIFYYICTPQFGDYRYFISMCFLNQFKVSVGFL
ncbi:hypothetical protein QZJ86_13855 [Methylomonas montana]|uniref:hypothetical protein n=1 Tax=Methylomonas montana TaxID=3058963 RepID=UPI002658B8D6|nr:hypothetical protein [Methylomonas montana]WKJ89103.1 hypothetical protein QZJ86_13855 [Methylomonas montana]